MRLLLIFLLFNITACRKEEGMETRLAHFYRLFYYRMCTMFSTKMTKYTDCSDCAEQAAAQIETDSSSEEDPNEMTKNKILKTKQVVAKCSEYWAEPEQLVACTKLDEDDLIPCLKRIFPVGLKTSSASILCLRSNKTVECEQCILDSTRKAWAKTLKRGTSDSEEDDELNDLMGNEATEIANNCNQFFKIKHMVKKCGTEEFGKRMNCITNAVFFNHKTNLIFQLCSYSKETSMVEDCNNCVLEAIYTEDNVDYDDELQKKESCKKALEKCGQYIERQEEMLECTNMEAHKMTSCVYKVIDKIENKKLAIKMCKNTTKLDECAECVYQSIENAEAAFYNVISEENSMDELDRLKFTEISSNCNQHFQKEDLKACSYRKYAGRVDCMLEN